MFGTRLKELRKENNLTQTELGKKINVSASTIGMYERENRKPTPETLNQIADYFEVTVDYLLGRTNQRYFKEEDTISFHAKKKISDKDVKTIKNIVDAYIDSLDEDEK